MILSAVALLASSYIQASKQPGKRVKYCFTEVGDAGVYYAEFYEDGSCLEDAQSLFKPQPGTYKEYPTHLQLSLTGNKMELFDDFGQILPGWEIINYHKVNSRMQICDFETNIKKITRFGIQNITETCLIFITPEEEYEEWVWYRNDRKEEYEAKGIRSVDAEKRYLSFALADGEKIVIDTKKKQNGTIYSALLYKKGQIPVMISISGESGEGYKMIEEYLEADAILCGKWESETLTAQNKASDDLIKKYGEWDKIPDEQLEKFYEEWGTASAGLSIKFNRDGSFSGSYLSDGYEGQYTVADGKYLLKAAGFQDAAASIEGNTMTVAQESNTYRLKLVEQANPRQEDDEIENSLEDAIIRTVKAYQNKDEKILNSLILKNFGIALIYKPGAIDLIAISGKLPFGEPLSSQYWTFDTVSTDYKVHFEELPVYDCGEEKWNKPPGIYCDTINRSKTLSSVAKIGNEYEYSNHSAAEIKKFEDIDLVSHRIIVSGNNGNTFVFSLTFWQNKWYLTVIDRFEKCDT
jgi:hypothetical protein